MFEELHPNSHPEHRERIKRSADEQDNDGIIMIYESLASGGDCGLNKFNKAKMKVDPGIKFIRLDEEEQEEEDDVTGDINDLRVHDQSLNSVTTNT